MEVHSKQGMIGLVDLLLLGSGTKTTKRMGNDAEIISPCALRSALCEYGRI